MKTVFLAALVAAAASAWLVAQTRERRDTNSGAAIYNDFCATCHGDTGRGDGPAADLGPKPSDLTRLGAAHGGVFPRAEVRAALDGTRPMEGHRTSMPKWHDVLLRLEHGDERTTAARIDALIAHLESLQK